MGAGVRVTLVLSVWVGVLTGHVLRHGRSGESGRSAPRRDHSPLGAGRSRPLAAACFQALGLLDWLAVGRYEQEANADPDQSAEREVAGATRTGSHRSRRPGPNAARAQRETAGDQLTAFSQQTRDGARSATGKDGTGNRAKRRPPDPPHPGTPDRTRAGVSRLRLASGRGRRRRRGGRAPVRGPRLCPGGGLVRPPGRIP